MRSAGTVGLCMSATPPPASTDPSVGRAAPPAVKTHRSVPAKPSVDGLEDKWTRQWEADGTYAFDRTANRSEVFSIDTPPPTDLQVDSITLPASARAGAMATSSSFYPNARASPATSSSTKAGRRC